MKRVLITGANGFTGRHLAKALQHYGYEVHGLTHSKPQAAIEGVHALHTADLADAVGLAAVIDKVQPQKIVHLAAIAFVAHGDVETIYRTNILGTRNLLQALVQSKLPIEAVLLASSANIYGNTTEGILNESTSPVPANDYAVSKLGMEHMARLYADRLPLVIARPFNYTGVGQSVSFLIPKIIDHVRRRAAVIELGNLDVARDFSDVRVVVAYYRRLLESPAALGQTLNVCSEQAHTLNHIVAMVRKLAGYEFKIRVNSAFVRGNEVKHLIGSCAKLEATVGKVPGIALVDTLRWMIEAEGA